MDFPHFILVFYTKNRGRKFLSTQVCANSLESMHDWIVTVTISFSSESVLVCLVRYISQEMNPCKICTFHLSVRGTSAKASWTLEANCGALRTFQKRATRVSEVCAISLESLHDCIVTVTHSSAGHSSLHGHCMDIPFQYQKPFISLH